MFLHQIKNQIDIENKEDKKILNIVDDIKIDLNFNLIDLNFNLIDMEKQDDEDESIIQEIKLNERKSKLQSRRKGKENKEDKLF